MAKKKPAKSKKPAKKVAKKAAAKKPAKKAAPRKAAKKAAPKKAAKKAAAKKAAPKKAAPKKAAPKPAAKPSAKSRIASAAKKAEAAQDKWESRPKRRVEVDESPRPRAGERDAAFVNRADKAGDDLAEELGEGFLQSATSGEEAGLDIQNEETEEEQGGPFIETTAQEEFADDVDESNPEDAEPAALPTTASESEAEE